MLIHTVSLFPFLSTLSLLSTLSPLAQAQTPTTDSGASVASQIYGFGTTNMGALATQSPSAISALATQVPAASILAMESQSSLLFASSTMTPPSSQATDVNHMTAPDVPDSGEADSTTMTRNVVLGTVLGFFVVFFTVVGIIWCVRHNQRKRTRGAASPGMRNANAKVYRDIEKNSPEPLSRGRSPKRRERNGPRLSRSRSQKHLTPGDVRLTTVCVNEVYDDLDLLGADGKFNDIMKPTRAHTKHRSRASKSADASRKSRASSRPVSEFNVNKPLPVPKLILNRDARGRSFVDSENPFRDNPFRSPPQSPLKSPIKSPLKSPPPKSPLKPTAPDAKVSPPSTLHSSRKSTAGRSTVSPSTTQTDSPPRAAAAPAQQPLQRTLTMPAATAPPPSARALYTPSVYSERAAANATPLAELDGMPGFAAFRRPESRLSRSPSLPLPRKSSRRALRPLDRIESVYLADETAAAAAADPERRRSSFGFGTGAGAAARLLADDRKASVASVASDIKRDARKPSPLRVVSGEWRRSRSASVGSDGAPLESPPWPPSRWSQGPPSRPGT